MSEPLLLAVALGFEASVVHVKPHGCCCFLREPNKTKLVTFFQTDLSGYLPQSVVDSFFPRSMAEFYPNLQKAVRKFHH